MTSHDVVSLIRGRFGFAKVGHAGTLDPMATGLLMVLIGSYTKLSDTFLNHDKLYRADVRLGVVTDTGDADGAVTAEKSFKVSENDVRALSDTFTGEISQVPPMYSAKKMAGKKLYELARKGIEVAREPVKVIIHSLIISDVLSDRFVMTVRCSKGTYIRQLAVDMGEKLGCGAHLTALRRLGSGEYSVNDSLRLDAVKAMRKDELIGRLIRQ